MATHPTVDELEKREEEAFKTGPLSVLTTSVKSNSQVLQVPGIAMNIVTERQTWNVRKKGMSDAGAHQLPKQQKATGTCEGF